MYSKYFKRILDIIFSVLLLIILSPFLLFIAVVIKITDGGNIFFMQKRIGYNGKPFRLYKFRSMPMNTKDLPSHLASTIKVTRIGKIIRRTNIDEIPQFINVIKGEMSVIGPRPALLKQTDVIKMRKEKGIFSLLPGLTGLAQVNAFDGMTAEQKVVWDEKYLHTISFVVDIQIVFRTFIYFLRKPPVY